MVATTASAAPPLAGATTEAWAQPVVVQAAGATPSSALPNQAGLGRGLGVATANVPLLSPLPATVVAFTDTQNPPGDQSVRVAAVLHGTTAPVIAPQTVTASKNTTTFVHVTGSDDDGDPLTWSNGPNTSNPSSSVSTADAARGTFAFKAAKEVGTDTFEAIATDGVPGHEAHALINVSVVNNPPKIDCTALVAREDTPYDIPIDNCVSDPNGDPLTINLDTAKGGTVERVAGTWRFIPPPHTTSPGSFVLHASDGDMDAAQLITVTIVANVGTTTIEVQDAGKRRTIARGTALRFSGTASNAQNPRLTLTWTFGDGSPDARGRNVAHRFRREGSFTVKAEAGGATKTIKVVVRRRAVEVVGAPDIADGVMTLRVRTRRRGQASFARGQPFADDPVPSASPADAAHPGHDRSARAAQLRLRPGEGDQARPASPCAGSYSSRRRQPARHSRARRRARAHALERELLGTRQRIRRRTSGARPRRRPAGDRRRSPGTRRTR